MSSVPKINEKDLEERVIKAYKKGVSLSAMSNLGICGSDKAAKILRKHGIIKKKSDYRPFITKN